MLNRRGDNSDPRLGWRIPWREQLFAFVHRGGEHPYVIEVFTPGWKGCEHAFDGTIKESMPADFREIVEVLKKANVKYGGGDPYRDGVMMFTANGRTEFVLQNVMDYEAAVLALLRAGWLDAVPRPASGKK